jgi:hypothetical protein
VTRSGTTARTLRDRRDDAVATDCSGPDAGAVTADDDPEHGLLDDYLRLALRLPTPPPARDTTELFAALWIHHVMVDAAAHRLLDATWERVAGFHPVFDLQLDHDPELHRWAIDHLDRAGELLAQAHPWARVRASCREGIGPFTGRPAELASWLDDGAFARLVLSGLGPLEDVLADLHHLLPAAVHARVLDTVEGWGLLAGPPPGSPP